ncbi:MAG: hypothetical protein ACRYFU_22660 [Janthinobacterium lividum]
MQRRQQFPVSRFVAAVSLATALAPLALAQGAYNTRSLISGKIEDT